eukprot:3012559-Pyramimonas_sp.AAC.1
MGAGGEENDIKRAKAGWQGRGDGGGGRRGEGESEGETKYEHITSQQGHGPLASPARARQGEARRQDG